MKVSPQKRSQKISYPKKDDEKNVAPKSVHTFKTAIEGVFKDFLRIIHKLLELFKCYILKEESMDLSGYVESDLPDEYDLDFDYDEINAEFNDNDPLSPEKAIKMNGGNS